LMAVNFHDLRVRVLLNPVNQENRSQLTFRADVPDALFFEA
jgi:hypothetical protein